MPDEEKLVIGLIILAVGYVLFGLAIGFYFSAATAALFLSAPFLGVGMYIAIPELLKMLKKYRG